MQDPHDAGGFSVSICLFVSLQLLGKPPHMTTTMKICHVQPV